MFTSNTVWTNVLQVKRLSTFYLDGLPAYLCGDLATNGTMARMNTVHPATFVAFKRWLSIQTEREARKHGRDVLKTEVVQELLEKYLPHF